MTEPPNPLLERPGPGAQERARSGVAGDPMHDEADVLSDVLRSVRLTGSMFFLVDASPPWLSQAPAASAFAGSVLPGAQHLISYHIVTEGDCWAGLTGGEPQHLTAGDLLIVPHGHPYFLSDLSPEKEPALDTYDSISFFRRMAAGELPTVVRVGTGGPIRTRFICGFLGCDTQPFNPILAALPPVVYLRRETPPDDRMEALVDFAVRELRHQGSGSRDVLLRLSELMFVTTVRRYVHSMPDSQPGWLAGLRDPLVAKILTLLHAEPGHAWTLEDLAARAGASRSVLAERFTRIVGEPPMRYLTAWRMQRAARLLADRREKVSTVAKMVGYDSEAAFSRAFRRFVGVSPNQWRQRV